VNISDFIKTYDDVVPRSHCDKVIDIYESNSDLVESHDTAGYKFHQLNLRSSPTLMGLENAFFGSLYPYYREYFNSVGMQEFVDIRAYEEIRIKKYAKNSGEEFKTHVDVMDKSSAVRYAIAILYLNDNDGFTEFPDAGIIVKPKAGRVVMFPPFWMFPHRGAAPTDHDKYIMMSCLHYI
jgi:prolyl 4-hydroxylase